MSKKTDLLERIAVAMETNNNLAERMLEYNKTNALNNEKHLNAFNHSVNMQIAATISNIAPVLKDNTVKFIELVQEGDLEGAYALTQPQKKTRQKKTTVEVKPKTTRAGKKSSANAN